VGVCSELGEADGTVQRGELLAGTVHAGPVSILRRVTGASVRSIAGRRP
jgi:hypothetical protein